MLNEVLLEAGSRSPGRGMEVTPRAMSISFCTSSRRMKPPRSRSYVAAR